MKPIPASYKKIQAAALAANMHKVARQVHVDQQEHWRLQADKVKKDPVKAFAAIMRSFQQGFVAASRNSEAGLNLEAFGNLVKHHLRLGDVPPTRLRSWFEACDHDRDGIINVADFFRFSVKASAHQCYLLLQGVLQQKQEPSTAAPKKDGTSQLMVELLMQAFDRSGDEAVNQDEFSSMASRLGFGETSDELFTVIDRDRSGVVSKAELIQIVKVATVKETAADAVHEFVMAISANVELARQREMVAASAVYENEKPRAKASTMRRLSMAVVEPPESLLIGGIGMEAYRKKERAAALDAFRRELVDALADSHTRAIDLFLALDMNGDRQIRRKEMSSGLRKLLKVEVLPVGIVEAIFDELDVDYSGTVQYD